MNGGYELPKALHVQCVPNWLTNLQRYYASFPQQNEEVASARPTLILGEPEITDAPRPNTKPHVRGT